MDTRRTILAIAISFLILLGWNQLAVHMGWVKETPVPQQQNQTEAARKEAQPVKPAAPEVPLPAFTPAPGKDVTVETPLYKAVFYSGGGVLRDFSLKKFHQGLGADSPLVQIISPAASAMAPMGLLVDGAPSWSSGSWTMEGGDLALAPGASGTLRFIGETGGLRLVRELKFNADKYSITETVTVHSTQPRVVRLSFTMSTGHLEDKSSEYNKTRVAYYKDGSFEEEGGDSKLQTGINPKGGISWASVMSNYFLAVVSPQDAGVSFKGKLQDSVYRVAVEKEDLSVSPGAPAKYSCTYYMGPKEQSLLDAEPNNMGAAVYYGWFSFIARPLMAMLKFFYSYVGNYGVAIIFLTLIIKIVLWPLSYKSYKSMEQMKKLQPMMAKLKEKYGNDKETLNREMMQLYKTYKVNPAGGCLPILVQIPVFFGLYQGLLNATELRHAAFIAHLPFTDMIWLADLSAKDPYYITPLIMGGTMFLQQLMTPSAGDPTQQKIMLIMPVVFTFLFLSFPSGLVIYWLANNVISIAQQWWQLRRA